MPQEQDKMIMKPALVVWGHGQSTTSSAGKKKQFMVRIIGQGSLGSIKVSGSGSQRHYIVFQGSHGGWKIWKVKMVMEKSWNMKNWPKVMEFCDQSWNFTNFAPELY